MATPLFDRTTYRARRRELTRRCGEVGVVLLLGHRNAPINYADSHYPFRQDATFTYFFGLDQPGLAAVIDLETGAETLFGTDLDAGELIWVAEPEPLAAQALQVAVEQWRPYDQLDRHLSQATKKGRRVHFLPVYRAESRLELARLLDCTPSQIDPGVSETLCEAVIALREVKSDDEIAEIEDALGVTRDMHLAAMRSTRPGVREIEVVAEFEAVMRRHGRQAAYAPIFTRRGEVLHQLGHDQVLERGDLVVNDSGASSRHGYASDITRTLPVRGRFSTAQKALYDIVLQAQQRAIDAIVPGNTYADVHRVAASCIAEGMKSLDFFRGDAHEIVASGAYAICFPHGVGHQMGLDVHDMESIGEDRVGYGGGVTRSPTFGPSLLRMAKALRRGMVLTVEPGLYFIPRLIHAWREGRQFSGLINYDMFLKHIDFGGIRIEDDVVVTESASRVLGPHIPKSCADIETAMAAT